jgi:Ca2+-binding RTX toxin-like protein
LPGIGNDTLLGGDGNDVLFAETGFDILEGGAGVDFLFGAFAFSTMRGGSGDDRLHLYTGNLLADGGPGSDALVLVAGFSRVDLTLANQNQNSGPGLGATVINFEHVDGSLQFASLELSAGFGDTSLTGGFAADSLLGRGGRDTIRGGPGIDTVIGGAGGDTFVFARGDAFVTGFGSLEPLLPFADRIQDFIPGLDRIDLSIYDGTLTFIGHNVALTGQIPEVATAYFSSNNFTSVFINYGIQFGGELGNIAMETIALPGNVALTSGDFIL